MCGIYQLSVELVFILSVVMGQRTGDVYIVFTDSIARQIWKLDVTNKNGSTVVIANHQQPMAIDYDPVQNKIYWTDIRRADIRSCGFNGENAQMVHKQNSVAVPEGMALDPISRLIFYTDAGNDVIAVMDMTDFYHKTIISDNLDQPRGITLDRAKRLMYWTDWGTQPKIERATYLGESRTTLVSTDLIEPSGITLDTQAQRVFWCDAKTHKIERIDFDGTNRRELVHGTTFHPFDMFLFEQVLYTTNWYTRRITLVSEDGRNISSWSSTSFKHPNGLHVFRAGAFQNDTNTCTGDKGGCKHICIPTPSGKQCTCADGWSLHTDGLSCTECQSINNCYLMDCKSGSNTTCTRCEGVVKEQAGLRAYVATSGRRQCRLTCSWRNESTRCYPGRCEGELATNCICHPGFIGDNCQTIVTKPSMQVLVQITNSDGTQFQIDSRTIQTSQASFWIKVGNPTSVRYKLSAQYTIPSSNKLPARPAYIKQFDVGIVQGMFDFKLTRGRGTLEIAHIHRSCGNTNVTNPKADLNDCDEVLTSSVFPAAAIPFRNKDKIQLLFETSNGGSVKVKNEETGHLDTFLYDGRTERKSFTLNIDLIKPYHCSVKSTCTFHMVDVDDVIKQTKDSKISVKSNGWMDDESGVTSLNIKIIQLRYSSGQLQALGDIVFQTTTLIGEFQTVVHSLITPGVYSILLSASDKAGNERKARRIVMYDPSSTITIHKNRAIRITSAIASTNYTWQWDTKLIRVDFTDRYTNSLQTTNNWLGAVADDTDIESQYDDHEGKRTVLEIPNKQGIVIFKTACIINPKGQQMTSQPADVLFEDRGLNTVIALVHQLVDGDVVSVWVKAYDIKDNVVAEQVQVQVDSSPPEISAVAVDNNRNVLQIIVTDRHSGIDRITWKITDKVTNTSFAFQEKHISHLDVTSCSQLTSLSQAKACYCTSSSLCYSREYNLKMMKIKDVKATYNIVVTVWNNAQHSTTTSTQMVRSIQVPTGDIITGTTSTFTWGSVFERLQGTQFYKYVFGPRCYSMEEVASDSPQIKVVKTTESSVSWTAPAAGSYFLTVVTFNSSAHPMHSKCSDVISVNEITKSLPIYIPIAATAGGVVVLIVIVVVVVKIKRKPELLHTEYDHLNRDRADQRPDRPVVYNIAYGLDDTLTRSTRQSTCNKEDDDGIYCELNDVHPQRPSNAYQYVFPRRNESFTDYTNPFGFSGPC